MAILRTVRTESEREGRKDSHRWAASSAWYPGQVSGEEMMVDLNLTGTFRR